MKLRLASDLELPDELVTQAIGILAQRRAGKSYTARRLAEQLHHAQQQLVIVDPKGDWWGIRSSADGKRAGIPITIIGGERGDVPLEAGGGELVAKLIVEERVSALLDLSLLRKHEIATFMAAFLEGLYRLKAREIYRTPLMLVIDEADAIAPQKPQPNEARMLGAAEDIVRRGGQRGIGCALITQRAAVLNKNVLTQVQVLITLRTIAPQDLKAVNEWIDVHGTEDERRTLMKSLPSLPTGDAWVWSPGWPTSSGIFARVRVLPIETFDSGETPKPGQKRAEPKTLADVDLEALRRQMGEVVERAKASDPKVLRARIAELERAAAAAPARGPDPADLERARAEARRETGEAADRRLAEMLVKQNEFDELLATSLESAALSLTTYAKKLRDRVALHQVVPRQVESWGPPAARVASAPRPRAAVPLSSLRGAWKEPSDGSLPPRRQRILDAIATLGMKYEDAPRELVALLAGTGHWVSTFERDCGALRQSDGLIEYRVAGTMRLTDAGAALAHGRELDEREIHDSLLRHVEPRRARIMAELLSKRGESVTREKLAQAAGTNADVSTFERDLGWLRSTADWIDYPTPGRVAARGLLFVA